MNFSNCRKQREESVIQFNPDLVFYIMLACLASFWFPTALTNKLVEMYALDSVSSRKEEIILKNKRFMWQV